MTRQNLIQALTLASLTTLIVAASGCSQGQSPTEPSASSSAASKSLVSSEKRHGADDPAGDDHGGTQAGGNQGGGADDPNGDRHGGRNQGGNQGGNQGNQGGQPRTPRGVEREGAVTAVDQAAGTLTLAGGKVIAVTAQTTFDRRGDLFTLAKTADAVTAGKHVRAEGRGTLQPNGSLLATTLKVEIDR
jgi:hypothetical protein